MAVRIIYDFYAHRANYFGEADKEYFVALHPDEGSELVMRYVLFGLKRTVTLIQLERDGFYSIHRLYPLRD